MRRYREVSTAGRFIGRLLLVLAAMALAAPARAQNAAETVGFILFYAQSANKRLDLTVTEGSLRYVERPTDNPAQNSDLVIRQVSGCVYEITGTLSRDQRSGSAWIGKVDWQLDFSGMYGYFPEKRPFGPGFSPSDNYELRGVKVCSRPTNPPFPPRPRDAIEGTRAINFPPAGECRNYVETATLYTDNQVLRMTAAIDYFRKNFCKGRAF